MVNGRPCKNCGAALNGRYCANCGQGADVRVASMSELISDLLGDLWSFDSRLWRSMLPLLIRPGQLTIDYLEGRRARYVPPFRMYVVLSLAFFVVASLVGRGAVMVVDGGEKQVAGRLAEDLQQNPDASIALPFVIGTDSVAPESGACSDLAINLPAFLDTPDRRQRLLDSCNAVVADSGDSFQRALADNVPMMMLLFIPLMAFVMKVIYFRTGRKYVEHLLFLLHFHAFFFLLALAVTLLSATVSLVPALNEPVDFVTSMAYGVYLPVYLFVAMRCVYGQEIVATGGKYVLLVVGYGMMMLISFLVMLAYTAYNL